MTKSIVTKKHNEHERTWIVPFNHKHKIHECSVFNAAGIKVKNKYRVIGDKLFVELKNPASGELVLAVSEKHNYIGHFMNFCHKMVTGFFRKLFG